MAATDVVMPLIGEGVHEATLTTWLVKEGDFVEKEAPLLEVSTDKVDTEIVAPTSGYLAKIFAKEGELIRVDQVIGQISSQLGDANAAPDDKASAQKSSPKVSSTSSPKANEQNLASQLSHQDHFQKDGMIRSSPLVRKIAKEFGIDLVEVKGSGLHGRITKNDILNYQEHRTVAPLPSASLEKTKGSQESLAMHRQVQTEGAFTQLQTNFDPSGQEFHDGVPCERKPMGRMRELIAKHMVDSVRISPHVTTVFEIDMNRIVTLREKYKDEFLRKEGFKLTYTPFLIHAAAKAILEHPIVNTSLDGTDILFKKDINIGCAVALDGGLIVPVIKKAGEKNLLGIARALNDLVSRSRQKKLKPDDVQGGTFTITNPGGFGSLTSNPIINQPQVAILGIGTIVKRPVVIDDMIAIRPQMLASLTFDHRVIDGEGGSRYLASFKAILEDYQEIPV